MAITVLTTIVSAVLVSTLAVAQTVTAPGTDVTFTKDIVPILQRSCQVCHRQGEMAPMFSERLRRIDRSQLRPKFQ